MHRTRPDPGLLRAADAGLTWLAHHANPDGGWGDTVQSFSNLSTTALAWAAFGAGAANGAASFHHVTAKAEDWLRQRAGGIEPDRLAPAVIARYGRDRTFSVPILTACALAGRLGEGADAWRWVIPLPFELAACPPSWFAALRLPVVSYALPALIAIGLARHVHAPSGNPAARWIRECVRRRTLEVLTRIQPSNGGFLEATPLTSFVTMSLAGSGLADHPVVTRGVAFLLQSQRPDGSWPIDTNLATWLTTLAIDALDATGHSRAFRPHHAAAGPVDVEVQNTVRRWLLEQQHRVHHPYTNAAPGGWAWTDLPGGVPDADDTAGALVALRRLAPDDAEATHAARAGAEWLLGLQNRDGGVPTFCRGWGTLPFDRSSADITAHALRAWGAWRAAGDALWERRIAGAMNRARSYLARTQNADGSWTPLWFGNQHSDSEENRTYGTARVLRALAADPQLVQGGDVNRMASRAAEWLVGAQNEDGSWGGVARGRSSVEETALAVEALAEFCRLSPDRTGADMGPARTACLRGAGWLVERVKDGRWTEPAPIGFYFARLWYFERLYPIIFTTGALGAAARLVETQR